MKRGLIKIIFLSMISLTGFINAQSVIGDILSGIDPTLITLSVFFVFLFAVLFFSTSKIFKTRDIYGRENRTIPAVISLAISFLAVYWINQSVSIGTVFTGLGISQDLLYTIAPIILLAALVFFLIKFKIWTLVIVGGILLLAGVLGLIYSTDLAIIIGIILIILGLFFAFRSSRRRKFGGGRGSGRIPSGGATTNVYNARHEQNVTNIRNEFTREHNILNEIRRDEASAKAEATQEKQKEQQFLVTEEESLSNQLKSLMREYNEIQAKDPSNPRLRALIDDMNNIRAEQRKLGNPNIPPSQLPNLQKEVLLLENKAQADEAAAAQIERGDIQTATERARQAGQQAMTERQQALNAYKNEYDSYKREYNEIMQEYNRLVSYDRTNPRIQKLAQDAQMITNEVSRIKAEMDNIERGG